jgi:hydrogenase-4 transcriptional activator
LTAARPRRTIGARGGARPLSEANEILRSYVNLLRQISGAVSVSLYVPPSAPGEREILTHDGRLDPLPELQDPEAALQFHGRFGDDGPGEPAAMLLPSDSAGGVLYRIPLRGARGREEEGATRERRRADARRVERTAWIGLRYAHGPGGEALVGGAAWRPPASTSPGDEEWWTSFLSLAAAFAAHARSVSNVQIDPVSGLPDRSELQMQLDAALLHTQNAARPCALLLLAPDDFAWVNERLDRRSGDQVLREVASSLRGALRSHDHVARYGGAIFTVILLEIEVADAERVAENLRRRLSEHRYHDGTLRLEFSVGIAAAQPGEPLDPQELVRRADQALSAAKRGEAAAVRVWQKGSDVEHASSLDRLQGIFTGDRAKDYRNMGLLLDSVAVVAASTDAAELARSFTQRLFDTLHARRVAVLERMDVGAFELLGGLERGDAGASPIQVQPRDLKILERACAERNFVLEREPSELSLCALPLLLAERCLGAILLEVAPGNVSVLGSDRRFLDALASQLALALDRARLSERERQRQHLETERLEAEVKDLRRVVQGSRLAYRSPAMESVLFSARKVARTDTTVLITGESGTGKELLAHTVHELSERQGRPFVIVDCGAISPTLIESELFGHEKGAFTGALARKQGRLSQADGATVFLDEIGEIPLDLQSKLLRFVQEKQLTPVGGVTPRAVDVRILAATNVDLQAKVAEGRFREDLFHRLNVVRLQLPPLRERQEDIVHLARLFLQQFAALYRRPAQRFTPRAEQALAAYAWPGNVRELQNTILNSVLFCDGPDVDSENLNLIPALRPALVTPPAPPVASAGAAPADPAEDQLEPASRLRRALAREIVAARGSGPALAPLGKWLSEDLILAAERLAGGRSRRAASLLGLPESTYRRQLRAAGDRRDSGQAVRSPSWPAVAGVLEDFIKSRPGNTDVCQWAEQCLLAEVDAAAAGGREAAALLGVTEPTLLRRKTQTIGHN